MRTIVIGDVHGCYHELKTMISKLKANKKYRAGKDRLIFLGDYIDRGYDSRNVVKFIRQLQKKTKKVVALMGNHEDMMLDFYSGIDEA